MTPHSPDAAGLLRDRRGFTLMELLVALVISSFLVTVIYQLMDGNSRFVRMQSAREEVQQNARAAIDVMAGDLRTVQPTAILAMGPDSLRFYMPRAFGVLCNQLDPNSATAWAIFPAGVLSSTDVFGKPQWGIAVEQTADPTVHTDVLRFVTGPTQQTAGNSCTGTSTSLQPNLNPAQHLALGFSRPSGTSYVSAGTILPGTQVVLFEEMKYDVAASSSAVPGSWIRRMVGRTSTGPNMQPMAGPVPATNALRFAYYKADGATLATTPADVRRINIRVITESRARGGTAANRRPEQMDTVSTDVFLRNVSN
jgi:prepilin-type N-terminal cleavage/methylation domain-containing protein